MRKFFKYALIYFFVLISLVAQVQAQAKKNLVQKSQKKTVSSKIVKEKPVIVYNEDYEKAEELFLLNKPAQAIPYYEKCIDTQNINPDIYIHLGVAYYQVGDFTRSLACCVKGLSKSDTDHKILAYNAGNSAYALANYARAEASYSIAIKEDENFAPAYLNRANAQLKQDRLLSAKENYEKYLELDPNTEQRPEIERLLALLDAEIERRAHEKPELINLDEMNIKNNSVLVEDDEREKVDYEIPSYKVDDDTIEEELVLFDTEPPALQEEPKILVAEEKNEESKIEGDLIVTPKLSYIEDNSDEEVSSEKIAASIMELDKNANQFAENIPQDVQKFEEPEIFGGENLPAADYTLPAGKVTVLTSNSGFSPNSPDSKMRKQTFTLNASDSANILNYTFEIIDEYGNTVKTIQGKKFKNQIEWDGKTDSGKLADGKYVSKITVRYKNGGEVSSSGSSFSCISAKPQLSVSFTPESFSPDGDGVDDILKVNVDSDSKAQIENWNFEVKKGSKTVYSTAGKGEPKDFEWDGKTSSGEYVKEGDKLEYKMSIKDSYGVSASAKGWVYVERSAPEPVVVDRVEVSENKDGSMNIAIPTLSFKINSSELVKTKQNDETIETVYNILTDEKFEDFKVHITGYVNPDGSEWTKEEKELALNRAKSVEKRLIDLGIPKKRLESHCGDGKTENKEYNRRVEFKLVK